MYHAKCTMELGYICSLIGEKVRGISIREVKEYIPRSSSPAPYTPELAYI
jgi:hypothetical protein